MNLDSLRDWLDSEEGQQSIIEFGEKLKRKKEREKKKRPIVGCDSIVVTVIEVMIIVIEQ